MRIAVLLILITFQFALAQNGHSLKFHIDDWKDTTIYLGHFYGETTYISDTARSNNKGEFVFDGKRPLAYRGVYFLVLMKGGQAMQQFQFVVSDDQYFSLSTKGDDLVKNMKVEGDLDNELFFDNMQFQMERHRDAELHIKLLRDTTVSADKRQAAKNAYEKISAQVLGYQAELIKNNPTMLTAKILKAYQPLKIPDAPKRADGSIDSTFKLKWYRQHFFDNFDLAEPGLLCLAEPLYKNKMDEYLDKLQAPQADSITRAIERIISVARKNSETYKYAVRQSMFKYQQPEIMGLDEVFVNVYDKYFVTGEMNYWVDKKTYKNIKDYADRLRKSLIGRLGENLIMQDASLKPRSMSDIKNKYTILYIFDPDCGHCKEETPKLVSFYKVTKFDVGVYAVCADSSIQKMKSYIKEMNMPFTTVNAHRTYTKWYQDLYDAITTPSLYVLDDKRRIIAKHLPAERLNDFLLQYEKFHPAKDIMK